MESITFRATGAPATKGSLTRMPNGAMLPAGTAMSRKRFTNWRDDCRSAAMDAMADNEPSRLPIRLMVEFQLPYPISSIRKWQLGWWPHIKKPDVDKLLRAVLDALTGIVWVDDSQVCFVTMNKVYAWNGQAGAHFIVDFLHEESMRRIGEAREHIITIMETL